jgi:hypothetical protein
MDAPVEFGPDERQTLEFAPLWMLSAVVGKYRDFNRQTLDALDGLLASAGPSPGPTFDVMVGLCGRLDDVLPDFERGALPIVSGLMRVDDLLERRPAPEAAAARRLLLDTVGMGIARARGPFGMDATREDAERLELAAAILTPTPPFGRAFDELPA